MAVLQSPGNVRWQNSSNAIDDAEKVMQWAAQNGASKGGCLFEEADPFSVKKSGAIGDKMVLS